MIAEILAKPIRAPFPWFGGKALAADLIWERFGAIGNYVEPFFGSGAVLLNAPQHLEFASVVNDIDGYVANFWRAIAADPLAVAQFANNQVNEIDLQARHQWLVDRRSVLTELLKADPEYFCAKSAGWWVWGCCAWIGGGWCGDRNKGQGVNKQIPHLGNKGQGVNKHEARQEFLEDWMQLLSDRLRESRITCGDWQRICSVGTISRFGVCGVLLDPPYGTTDDVYACDSSSVAIEVQRWCFDNGHNSDLRIALCGHVGQHEALEDLGWIVESPAKGGGYQGADDRERIWFSPHCIQPAKKLQLALF